MRIKNHFALLLIGSLLIGLALVAAFFYEYKHFYEMLVVGLFLIQYVFVGNIISDTEYKKMTEKFFKAGLVADLILGVTITNLWHYNYQHLIDYLPLYTLVYPFAGLVMIQSYVLVKHWLGAHQNVQLLSQRFYSLATSWLLVAWLALATLTIFASGWRHILWPALFMAITVYILFAFSLHTRLKGTSGIFDAFFSHPFRMLVVILLVSYFNAFLHEIPNTVAHEWTYANWPLQETQLFNIPIVVLIGWPFLTLYPAAVYYYVHSKNHSDPMDRESWSTKLFPLMLPPKSK